MAQGADPPCYQPPDPARLTPAQAQATAALLAAIADGSGGEVLLEGLPGAGKTEIYLEAIAATLARGRSALVLLPEIALGAQWLDRFTARFGAEPLLWHSGLTALQRRRAWKLAAAGRGPVVVGARSALFLPMPELGLVIDEERGHELQAGGRRHLRRPRRRPPARRPAGRPARPAPPPVARDGPRRRPSRTSGLSRQSEPATGVDRCDKRRAFSPVMRRFSPCPRQAAAMAPLLNHRGTPRRPRAPAAASLPLLPAVRRSPLRSAHLPPLPLRRTSRPHWLQPSAGCTLRPIEARQEERGLFRMPAL
ncbi:MAG: DEAD/DEAH box helicase family protein [Geminicoccaceae bacterium]